MRRSLLLLCLAVLACDSAARRASSDSSGAGPVQHERAAQAVREGYDEVAVTAVPELPTPTLFDVTVTNMIIRTATATVEVDSLEPAVAQLNALATRLGGYVGGTGIETGKNQYRKAFVEVKIPAARFNDVLAGLKPIGQVEAVNVNAEDVGEEFVDVQARMDNARRLEQRLIGLLATRTGKLKDVLDVEQALAQVREEIERYEGRIRYLQAHTAMSTLSITVHEPVPVVGDAGKSVMGEAFKQAWRNFVVFLSVLVQSLGVILPLGLIAGVVWFVTRRLKLGGAQRAVNGA